MPQIKFTPKQLLAFDNPFQHFAFIAGVAGGKTYVGSQFAINQMLKYPELTGFLGSNTFDQMTQATLRELFYWLDEYDLEYVSDRMPPEHWSEPRKFKKYSNILSVRVPYKSGYKVVYVFTRVLSKGNPLRGLEFSWYWIDETRDTPQDTHDIILSRLRESDHIKGLITTTANGEDWVYKRFVKNKSKLYGSIHSPTYDSVEYGIITQDYYDTMRSTYSEMMAAQELDAQHVNVLGGRAYYSFGTANRQLYAPWGDVYADETKPLIVGCDFNYNPSPCVWMIGQIGIVPGTTRRAIHWFGELSGVEKSSEQMTIDLLNRFPDFHYMIYGDASGTKGTTSNQGLTDYIQITEAMNRAGATYSLDVDPSNPKVKDRVENMNRLAKNALGHVCITYNPDTCPLFDADVRMVGWKQTVGTNRNGKLDNGGDLNRTHATDGAGYAIYKLFPPAGVLKYGLAVKREHAEVY